MDPMESIIGETLLDVIPKDLGIARMTCNLAARTQMFCRCGSVLDQSTVQVLEIHDSSDDSESTIVASCPDCMADTMATIKDKPAVWENGTKLLVLVTWKGMQTVKSILGGKS